MNIFSKEKWWPVGQLLNRRIHNGVLPITDKNKLPQDLLILSKEEFVNFRKTIIPFFIKNTTEDNQNSTEKKLFNDYFLDDEYIEDDEERMA